MMIVVLIVLTDGEIAKANTNVLYAIADKLFPRPWSYLAVLATLLSTIGTIETQILQFSRSVFAMARDDMLPPRLAKIHPKWRTPWVATLAIWFSGVLLLLGSSYLPSVNMILQCSIDAIGFQICFYMSLTGFCLRLALPQGIERRGVQRRLLCALALVGSALHGIHRGLQYSDPRQNHKHRRDRRHRDRLCAFALGRLDVRPSDWCKLKRLECPCRRSIGRSELCRRCRHNWDVANPPRRGTGSPSPGQRPGETAAVRW